MDDLPFLKTTWFRWFPTQSAKDNHRVCLRSPPCWWDSVLPGWGKKSIEKWCKICQYVCRLMENVCSFLSWRFRIFTLERIHPCVWNSHNCGAFADWLLHAITTFWRVFSKIIHQILKIWTRTKHWWNLGMPTIAWQITNPMLRAWGNCLAGSKCVRFVSIFPIVYTSYRLQVDSIFTHAVVWTALEHIWL